MEIQDKLGEIDTSSLVDKVEHRLMEYIKENQLKVGDVLPKELDLSDSFGVSRTVIREALLRLKTIGLIESKKHKGAVICNPDVLGPLRKVFHPAILDHTTLKDMFEMRLALEVGMADFIVNKITEEDIVELEGIAKEIVSGDTAAPWQVNDEIRFHGKLYSISQNKVLLELQELLIPIFQYVHQSSFLERPIVKGDFISHEELVEVLKKRDAEAYRKAIRQHLNNHFARILNVIP
ncbi:FadR family transcriptional regulator [Sphingobacterium shayense]|uniref:FadR/GntR family transcriptional regulator n=1 Tax=Sphingobacterium shayense TaxID=626343 RepID=UPI0015551408|nr:FadR/GntR family transcriptional regulator [Sphingobacterium shayense]NQD70874.1 FadR family transcriptional regulator [Sphingobacterium shayense]